MEIYTVQDADLNITYIKDFITMDQSKIIFDAIAEIFNERKDSTYRRVNTIVGDEGIEYLGTPVESWDYVPYVAGLKPIIEKMFNTTFNTCSAMWYQTGRIGIKPHRDREMHDNIIVGLSLGATRTLEIVNSSPYAKNRIYQFILYPGSLYAFHSPTNLKCSHSILKDPTITEPRISLTFRDFPE